MSKQKKAGVQTTAKQRDRRDLHCGFFDGLDGGIVEIIVNKIVSDSVFEMRGRLIVNAVSHRCCSWVNKCTARTFVTIITCPSRSLCTTRSELTNEISWLSLASESVLQTTTARAVCLDADRQRDRRTDQKT